MPTPLHLRKRLFAWLNTGRGQYEEYIAARKRALLGSLHGDVLEIGPGAGVNLRYYPAGVRWLGVEPNPYMHPYLEREIRLLRGGNYRIDSGDPGGVRLPAADASQDAVVGTLVLCSVPDPDGTLAEILRVLKPGGRFVFIEHVAAPRGTRTRLAQTLIQPAWSFFGDGCHPNRETGAAIRAAGFARVELEEFQYPGSRLMPLIAGVAYRS